MPKSTQDAFFVGFAQGPDDYLMGWTGYGNKTIGIDACVAGTVRSVRGSMPAPAVVGDRWAMAFDGTNVSLWLDRGHGFEVAFGAATADLGSLGAVTDYRYAVGLRGTAGTLSATRFVGRSG